MFTVQKVRHFKYILKIYLSCKTLTIYRSQSREETKNQIQEKKKCSPESSVSGAGAEKHRREEPEGSKPTKR